MIRRFLVSAIAILLCACGSLPDAPLNATDDPEFQQSEEVKLPGLSNDPPTPMTLLPGDVVTLRVLSQEPMETPGLVVDEKGSLPVPLVGEVEVAGLTLRSEE